MSTATLEAKTETTRSAKKTEQAASATGEEMSQIVSFRLADEEYGVDIMRAQEIIMIPQVTRMPEVPDFICGLINLRGHVIPVVDLRKRFGLPVTEKTEHTRIIVANVGMKTIGIVVDAVTEVLRITDDQIEPPPSGSAGVDHEYIRGIFKRGDKLIILLRIEEILSASTIAALTPAMNRSAAATA